MDLVIDDKAKIGLGILVIGHMFKAMQLVNKSVTIKNNNFPKESKIKLRPLVYLLIDSNDSNTTLHFRQLTIFIRPEYFVNISFLMHIADLLSLVNNQDFDTVLLKENEVRPVWVLLVNKEPNENLKHFKNIIEYYNLFWTLDLNYLTICTHALYQSAYNPVEKSMASLLKKLANITLPIDKY
ncbi:17761_t:CDS:2, partial [Cetraspora pellucida]